MPNGLLNNLFYNLKKKQMDREKLREARAIAGWAHLDKKSGTGNGTVQVTIDAYLGRNDRNTSVQVATNGGVSKNVSVVQNGKAIYITKESDPNVGAAATTATVKFKTNVEKFKLEIGNSGTVGSVKVNNVDVPEAGGIYTPAGDPGASSEYTVTVVVNFAANGSIQNKQYTVKASDSVNAEVSATATITQSAADSNLTVSPEQLTFEATGGAKTITITSNDSWTIA
jgi:hypothetical protein